MYRRNTDEVISRFDDGTINEVRLDESGRYLVVITGAQGPGIVAAQVVDLETGETSDLIDDVDEAFGHYAVGDGIVFGRSHYSNELNGRELADPYSVTTALSYGDDWSSADHHSLLANDDTWALVSNYSSGGFPQTSPWREEIWQVQTDGSGGVRRLAHHRSVYTAYDDSPRANVSADGCLVTFTSNWGNPGGRTDVYVASLRR